MNLRKRLVLFLWTIGCLPLLPLTTLSQSPAPSAAPQVYWQQQVDYTIDVTLNDTEHALDGFLKMVYANNSPDTLSFIWIHLWPNAYKNDQTAFSEQLLGNGRTDFYFSDKEKKGYINHLDFRVEGTVAKMEDHPQYIDIIKILLPHPLLPGGHITITTPFHEQLPFPFSGSGYNKGNYQVSQWYPTPAVYDQKGWHPIPYLDQGGFYREYGSFDVRITLPPDYTVAATGELLPSFPSGPATPTFRYQQKNSQDFSWSASKRFRVEHDTLQLTSGRVIELYAYYTPETKPTRTATSLRSTQTKKPVSTRQTKSTRPTKPTRQASSTRHPAPARPCNQHSQYRPRPPHNPPSAT